MQSSRPLALVFVSAIGGCVAPGSEKTPSSDSGFGTSVGGSTGASTTEAQDDGLDTDGDESTGIDTMPRPDVGLGGDLGDGTSTSTTGTSDSGIDADTADTTGSQAREWSLEALEEARIYSESIDTAAFMLVVDGHVLASWGDVSFEYYSHSIRKSLLSALIGMLVAEGKLTLSSTLQQLGIDDSVHPLTAEEKQATVGDLLESKSGVYLPANAETDVQRQLRPDRGSYPPGTYWYYNNWDFNALGTIYQQASGSDIYLDFDEKIAKPLNMLDYSAFDQTYQPGPDSSHPSYPFVISTRDLASFGQLFLQDGMWDGQQMLSPQWVADSTMSYAEAFSFETGLPAGGYGYMWWIAVDGVHFPGVDVPEGTYSARGIQGHFVVVIPSLDAVIVHRVNTTTAFDHVTDDEFGHLLSLVLGAAPA